MHQSLQRGLSRRQFLRWTGATTVCAALAACAPQGTGDPPRASTKAQLVFQDCRCLGEQFLLQNFHATHPNIEVFYNPEPENFEEKMLTDMESGTAPDVLAGCCDTLPIWAQ